MCATRFAGLQEHAGKVTDGRPLQPLLHQGQFGGPWSEVKVTLTWSQDDLGQDHAQNAFLLFSFLFLFFFFWIIILGVVDTVWLRNLNVWLCDYLRLVFEVWHENNQITAVELYAFTPIFKVTRERGGKKKQRCSFLVVNASQLSACTSVCCDGSAACIIICVAAWRDQVLHLRPSHCGSGRILSGPGWPGEWCCHLCRDL